MINQHAWIETYTGKHFNPLLAKPEDIDIEDIAHALSNMCRFTGHCRFHYSVAQHSCYVHDIVATQTDDKRTIRLGLHHDSPEAYIADIATPVKQLLPSVNSIEDGLMAVIAIRFDLHLPMPEIIKLADREMLATEALQLFDSRGEGWGLTTGPAKIEIEEWTPARAKQEFLDRHYALL